MRTVDQQIQSAADTISSNIVALSEDRALLAQNILSQLRNLVEGIAVRVHTGSGGTEFHYNLVGKAMNHLASHGQLNFIARFHKQLQITTSHYTMGGDPSERLMLKYYGYLLRVRDLARLQLGLDILHNLEDFPFDLEPSLRDYYDKISKRIEAVQQVELGTPRRDRYYIHSVRPFVANRQVYSEVTFYVANNRASKSDRIVGFTDIDLAEKYAANLVIQTESIDVFGNEMPITIIRSWEVSIRPCEFDNLGRVFGRQMKTSSRSPEYQRLMQYLTTTSSSLLDILEMSDARYNGLREWATERSQKPQVFNVLDDARRVVESSSPGHNVIRYLMLRMNNQIIKLQTAAEPCSLLSSLNLKYGCNPFETMPFCTSLVGHNPRFSDLVESVGVGARTHELLARRIKNNVEDRSMLYTPIADLEALGDVDELLSAYNEKLYYTHTGRKIRKDKGHVFIREYEDAAVAIIQKLQNYAEAGIAGHAAAASQWLTLAMPAPDDALKAQALQDLFSDSRVALIHGAAGTGKSTMISLISDYFATESKLFLAHTNPAVDNLKRRVDAPNSTFRTISRQVNGANSNDYDLLVIDECSTVSNSDLLTVLERTSFEKVVLVGDLFQIESIQFGNWFGLARTFIPSSAVFELTTPFRTKNDALLDLWSSVRDVQPDIEEKLAKGSYSAVLDESLLEARSEDEIILCLNYDGLYGINNINRFLQAQNPETATVWGAATYKVGDPVLFNESDRFRPVIYNNLKGKIVGIQVYSGHIQFDVSLERSVSPFDASSVGLRHVEGSTVSFDVHRRSSGDEDDDSTIRSVPFQVAYAVSIHKAQGLEFDSVKVVITDANEGDISHSVFYTSITRAREELQIFWTPETEHAVVSTMQRAVDTKDAHLMASRRGLSAIS